VAPDRNLDRGHLLFSTDHNLRPSAPQLCGGDDWAAAAAAAAALRAQVSIFVNFAGDEHPLPGTRTPSLPLLLCETEHPNPSYFYSDRI